mgnify:CR=1 FL=1|jgi:hypothetical protein
MLRSQGIDANIDRTMDAFRGKEEQLHQRYNIKKDLIDLLALQKLKTEQDSKAREIQLSMEQSPETVRQQMEGEMLERSKQEVVKQTAGLLGQAQKKKQQNMQGQGQQPPVGIERMMAAGGPVKFTKGNVVYPGGVTQAEIDRMKLTGGAAGGFAGMTDMQIAQIIAKAKGAKGVRPQVTVGQAMNKGPGQTLSTQAPQNLQVPKTSPMGRKGALQAAQEARAAVPVEQTDYVKDKVGTAASAVGKPAAQVTADDIAKNAAALGYEQDDTNPLTAMDQTDTRGSVRSLVDEIGVEDKERRREAMLQDSLKTGYQTDPLLKSKLAERMDTDPIAARKEASEWAGETLDRRGSRQKYEDLAKRRAAKTEGIEGELKKLYGSPEQNKREQYMAMLAGGAGGGGSLAGLGRGMYKGLYGARDKQRENTRANLLKGSNLFDKQLEITRQGAEADRLIGSDMVKAGASAAKDATSIINAATNGYALLDTTEQRNLEAESKRVFDLISDEKKNALEKRKLDILERGNEMRMDMSNVTEVRMHLDSINKHIATFVDAFLEGDITLSEALVYARDNLPETEQAAYIQEARDKAMAKAIQSLNSTASGRALLEQQEDAMNVLQGIGASAVDKQLSDKDVSKVIRTK